jgi:hypothetical protein
MHLPERLILFRNGIELHKKMTDLSKMMSAVCVDAPSHGTGRVLMEV